MATILDASVMGDLQCEPNVTAGQITVTTNNVTPDRDFSIRIVASNSRKSAEISDNTTSKWVFVCLTQLNTLEQDSFMCAATYDIFDLDAISSVASQLDFSLSFIQETRAQGAFMSFLFRNNGQTNFANSLFFIINRATATATNQLTPLPMGNYLAQAYDLEANGEISIEQPADQEMVTIVGPTDPGSKLITILFVFIAVSSLIPLSFVCDLAPVLLSLGATINCSSNLTSDGSAVTVMCSYDSAMYSGCSVCIMNQIEFSAKCILSTESGSMVIVNGTVNGEHEVFVNPTWISSPPMGMLECPHRETYTLTNVAVLTTSMSSTLAIWQM